MTGGLAWFICANIFIFNDQGLTCSFEPYDPETTAEQQWQSMWVFQRRAIVGIWAFLGIFTAIACGYGFIKVFRIRYDPNYEPGPSKFLDEEYENNF